MILENEKLNKKNQKQKSVFMSKYVTIIRKNST